jgi:HEPN domain-containing protein
MKRITQEWLDRAQDDLDAIEELLTREHLTNIVAFHAQQAVEKTLKAVIEELEIGLRKTHNLLRLDELIRPHYTLIQDMEMLERLDTVYTESRYPDDMGLLPYGKPTIEDAKEFYRFAQAVHASVSDMLAQPPGESEEQEHILDKNDSSDNQDVS